MNAPSQSESTAVAVAARQQFDLSPQTFEQALTFAQYLADSDLVPKDFKGKPANCLIGMQWGIELGMKPLQAIQNIAVINGRPNLWGDAMLALVRSSPLCEYVVEDWMPDGTAFCKAKRRGEPEQIRTFSDADAKLAGLLGKAGPWTTGPKRMKQLRARAFALRDVFTDVLRGMGMAEEAMDAAMSGEAKHMGAAEVVPGTTATPAASTALPEWTDAELAKRETKIGEFYGKGKTADDIIAFYSTKATLSEAQKKRIRSLAPAAPAAADQAQDVTPKVTYAVIADRIAKAQDTDALEAAKALIEQISDEQQRGELTRIADERGDELPPY